MLTGNLLETVAAGVEGAKSKSPRGRRWGIAILAAIILLGGLALLLRYAGG